MTAIAKFLEKRNAEGGIKGQLGKSISLRDAPSFEFVDAKKALAHFVKENPVAFQDVLEKLTRAALKEGAAVPGVKVIPGKRAQ